MSAAGDPAALHVGMALGNLRLVAALNELIESFRAKGREFGPILKLGRTQRQDAAPMTIGQAFTAFAETLAGEVHGLEAVQRVLCEIKMGATAPGSGLNEPAGYAPKCTTHPAAVSGLPRSPAADLMGTQAFVLYSSCMKSLAIKLSKVCNDLRLLSSGSRCGLREINQPPRQPGSSIMPGKTSPVIHEVANMVGFRAISSDQTITMAAGAAQPQLAVSAPVIAAVLFEAQTIFINAADTLRVRCVDGITASPEVCWHEGHARDGAGGRGHADRPRNPRAQPRTGNPLRRAGRRCVRLVGNDRSPARRRW